MSRARVNVTTDCEVVDRVNRIVKWSWRLSEAKKQQRALSRKLPADERNQIEAQIREEQDTATTRIRELIEDVEAGEHKNATLIALTLRNATESIHPTLAGRKIIHLLRRRDNWQIDWNDRSLCRA